MLTHRTENWLPLLVLLFFGGLMFWMFSAIDSGVQHRRGIHIQAERLCQDVPGRDYTGCIRQQKTILRRQFSNGDSENDHR